MSESRAAQLLRSMRNDDGGMPPSENGASEPEPTALASIALDDARAVAWLESHQAGDGGYLVGPPGVGNDSPTPLAALALPPGPSRDRALAYVIAHQVQPTGNDERFPHDADTRGWGWTSRTFGWVEPTARAVHALKVLAPSGAADVLADGLRVLEDRECANGGWNYGNPEVLGRALEPYLQTTAAAVIALHDQPGALRDRGVAVLRRLWRDEQGGLGWAMTLVALELCGVEADDLSEALDVLVEETLLFHDAVALGWAAVGMGPALNRMRVGA